MTKLSINKDKYSCLPDETVLDALIRQDVDITYSCMKGTCHSCLTKSLSVKPPASAQKDLKDTLIKQNYFLACCCIPEQDMVLKLADQSEFYTEGKIIVKQMLNRNTVLLLIECKDILDHKAGQFVNLQRTDGLTRSYSIANIPQESNILEFHIRVLPGGKFSEWIANDLKEGDLLAVSEPQGHCFYMPERKQQSILLVGTGTGLAPLAGIVADALSQGHSGSIHLFHGSREVEDLYRIKEMQKLSEENPNFNYIPCISGKNTVEGFSNGRVNEVALKTLPDLSGWRIFLCGNPDMVEKMKLESFLKGASMTDIYTDAFLTNKYID